MSLLVTADLCSGIILTCPKITAVVYKAQYNRHVVVVPGKRKDASFEFKATVVIVVAVVSCGENENKE